jgi:hypothetical protein
MLFCASGVAQTSTLSDLGISEKPDYGPGPLKKIPGLTAEQQEAVEAYVQAAERRTGELEILIDRNQIMVRSSEALGFLLPDLRLVSVTSLYRAKSAAAKKYSIPGPLTYVLVLDQDGKNAMPKRTGYLEEYGELLHVRAIKVADQASAALVRAALVDIYGFGMGTDIRHRPSAWYIGYQEHPFRAISSSQEVREASYYLLTTGADGLVIHGRLVNEVLQRRKIN